MSIIGATNLPSTMPHDASQLYSRNVYALLSPLINDGALTLDMNDEIDQRRMHRARRRTY